MVRLIVVPLCYTTYTDLKLTVQSLKVTDGKLSERHYW